MMRDTFYSWLALLVFMAIYFGASVARATEGHVDLLGIIGSAIIGVAAGACLGGHYGAAIAATQSTEQPKADNA